ncbi:hypothetical protein HPB49_018259 [Dermacentor silvarum]|uniref:Uncharacterized protein n=1 Tax=Dermacentor silvarum TaxID=543639 RepID=A0ACB8CZ75_DERSI|nr:hypothetical protein HPB49_018259 [Dermacentor silvarum]
MEPFLLCVYKDCVLPEIADSRLAQSTDVNILERKKGNLTPEEALNLYFSLPDLESASEDDSEDEYFEELACELRSKNDSGSDEVELAVPTVKRKKKTPRVYTGKQKKMSCSSTAGSSATADASDSDMEVQWEMTPADVQLTAMLTLLHEQSKLGKTCKVCVVHVVQDNILNTYNHVIDGWTIKIDHGCWALKPDAVRRQFPNIPRYLSRKCKRRKSPKKRASVLSNTVPAIAPSVESQLEVCETMPDSVQSIGFAQIVEKALTQLPRKAAFEEEVGKHREVVL